MNARLSQNGKYVKQRSATHKWYRAVLHSGSENKPARLSKRWFKRAGDAVAYHERAQHLLGVLSHV